MKPKNKYQKLITNLSSSLKPISNKQMEWAINKCSSKLVVISRKTIYCLECGHKWKDAKFVNNPSEKCMCPNCNASLTYNEVHNIDKEGIYFAILTTKMGIQVVRLFLLTKSFKKKEKCKVNFNEVMQYWIWEDGKCETLSKPVHSMCGYYDAWSYGHLEPRTSTYAHNMRCSINPDMIYPHQRVLSVIKRNGFKGQFHGLAPQMLFRMLLRNNKAEILLKSNQISLLKEVDNTTRVNRYWSSIMICIRNGYEVKDSIEWFDYLKLLEDFGKDLKNSKYVCPENLSSEHNKYVERKNKNIDDKKIKEYQEQFKKEKGKFFDLNFQDDNIVISPLKSIEEFKEEANVLKHCVYSNEYYKRENSLIMSAKIDGQPIETIEVCLSSFSVVQSRGKNNKITEYHDKIVNLLSSNTHYIQKAMAV